MVYQPRVAVSVSTLRVIPCNGQWGGACGSCCRDACCCVMQAGRKYQDQRVAGIVKPSHDKPTSMNPLPNTAKPRQEQVQPLSMVQY